MLKRMLFVSVVTLGATFAGLGGADAGSAGGTAGRKVEVLHGERRSTTTWKNTSGRKGDVQVKTIWDPERKKPEPEAATDENEAGEETEATEATEATDATDAPEAGKVGEGVTKKAKTGATAGKTATDDKTAAVERKATRKNASETD